MSVPSFRPYEPEDRNACLALFDANCPEFFAPNERADYFEFLDQAGAYVVCVDHGQVVGAYGLEPHGEGLALRWIMLARDMQGRGLGSLIMQRVRISASGRGARVIHIAASHKSAPFFAKAGAQTRLTTPDGWGPGMDRIDMVLALPPT